MPKGYPSNPAVARKRGVKRKFDPTPEQIQFIKANLEKLGRKGLAAHLGCTYGTLYKWLIVNGLAEVVSHDKSYYKSVYEYAISGTPTHIIAAMFRISTTSVNRILSYYPPLPHRRKRSLTNDARILIRSRIAGVFSKGSASSLDDRTERQT